uniref:Uncharacterized protein n=1 Tax=Cacopsylla melanoneura TaxID=428564 RepID=A0A8D8XSK2_9HEMI
MEMLKGRHYCQHFPPGQNIKQDAEFANSFTNSGSVCKLLYKLNITWAQNIKQDSAIIDNGPASPEVTTTVATSYDDTIVGAASSSDPFVGAASVTGENTKQWNDTRRIESERSTNADLIYHELFRAFSTMKHDGGRLFNKFPVFALKPMFSLCTAMSFFI